MIAALSAADQRRRRTDPVETATPRSSHFASLLPSNITITRSSPLLQAEQASQPLPLKKGARTPLTTHLRFGIDCARMEPALVGLCMSLATAELPTDPAELR